jgi:hypothetical protein
MERIRRYYDRKCKRASLNTAIVMVGTGASVFSIGLCMVIKYSQSRDDFGKYLGITNAILGVLNTFNGYQMVHAVARRLRAEQPAGLLL